MSHTIINQHQKIMIKNLSFAAFLFNIIYSSSAYCSQNIEFEYSHLKLETYEEKLLIDKTVGWQTGCTIPDLSKSPKAGATTLKLFLNQQGNPTEITIDKTTGTTTDNNIIVAAIKRCNFAKFEAGVDVPSHFYITFKIKWDQGENKPMIGLRNCLQKSTYPMLAYRLKQEGTVKWAVRPISNNQFEKKLLIDSGSTILNRHTEKELDRCLQNPDVAQSIRDNFEDGQWDEFGANYTLQKQPNT